MAKDTSELFRKAILVTLGATALTIEKVNSIIDELVVKGEMSEQQAKSFKKEVKEKAIAEKESFESKVTETVQKSVHKVFKEIGIVTTRDLQELEKRICAKISGEPLPEEEEEKEEQTDACQCEESKG